MPSASGIVERIHTRDLPSGSTAYNFVIDGVWYSNGFEEPIFKQHDYISFDYRLKGEYKNVIKGTVSVGDAPKQELGAQTATASPSGGRTGDTQIAIQYQASRNAAIELMKVAIPNGLLPLPKAGAERYDAVLAAVDDLTNQFYVKTDMAVKSGGIILDEYSEAIGTPKQEDF